MRGREPSETEREEITREGSPPTCRGGRSAAGVELAREEARPVTEVARDLEIGGRCLRACIAEAADPGEGWREGPTNAEGAGRAARRAVGVAETENEFLRGGRVPSTGHQPARPEVRSTGLAAPAVSSAHPRRRRRSNARGHRRR